MDSDQEETSIKGRSSHKRSFWLWQKKLACHLYGQYSMATARANRVSEDRCQLVSGALTDAVNGPRGVFVGVYDGHGGTICAQYVLQNLFDNLKISIARQPGQAVNPAAIKEAYERTDHSFLQVVRNDWNTKPQLASTGSCCLTGLVHNNVLYVANAGNSRAVLARWPEGGQSQILQLSVGHDANDRDARDELRLEHPDDTGLFKCVGGSICVRGKSQLTRAIGDVYLKYNEFNRDPLPAPLRQQQPIVRPILKADPTVQTYQLGPDDRFVIFGSNGLWEKISNEEAASLVGEGPRSGAAMRLTKEVLERAARKKALTYQDLKDVELSDRLLFHDDITVIVVFIDKLVDMPLAGPELSGGCPLFCGETEEQRLNRENLMFRTIIEKVEQSCSARLKEREEKLEVLGKEVESLRRQKSRGHIATGIGGTVLGCVLTQLIRRAK